MKKILLLTFLCIPASVGAESIRLTCSSDKVFSIYKVGNSYESHEVVNKLTTSVSINLSKSEIKISWRNDTQDTTGDINMKIIDVKYGGKIILGSRAGSNSSYELQQFDLENLQTSWTMIEPSVDMYMLSKCLKLN